jgi:hypothetical protein
MAATTRPHPLNVARPAASISVWYDSGHDLARAVLARAFIDATTYVPDWSRDDHAQRVRDERADAIHFLLSLDKDTVALRRLWYTLAERPEPKRAEVIAILDRYAKAGIPRPGHVAPPRLLVMPEREAVA